MSLAARPASAVLALALALMAGEAARAETLADAMALAYQGNPTLQGQRAAQRALDETYVQAQAGFRPTAQAQATLQTSNSNCANTFGTPAACSSVGQVRGESQETQAQLSVTQPIYTGGLVASQVTAAEAQVLAGREGLRQTEEQVLQNVVTVYVNVRRDQESVSIALDNVRVLHTQLDESRARFDVGEITRTDVAETEAQVAGAESQLSTAQAQLATDRATYAAVVGQNPGSLAPEPPIDKLLPAGVDQAFDLAQRNNPQLRQADYTEQSSAAKVAEAKAQSRPTIALRGTFGYINPSPVVAQPFINYTRDITGALVITAPITTGGLTSSQVRQAAENNNVDRISIEITRRQVILNVAQAWNQLLGARASLKASEAQVKAANIAFEGSRQEARVGLRSTLDVLITEQNLANAEFALVNARHDEYVAAATLLAAMGALYIQDFAVGVPIYDPKANFDKVRGSWKWTPWDKAVESIDNLGAPKVEPPPPPAPIGR